MEVKANKARMAKGKEKRTEKKRRYREKKKNVGNQWLRKK